MALPGTHDAGTVLAGHVEPGGKLVIDETVAKAKTAEARAWTLAAAQHLDPSFPVQALEEAALILAKPGLDDTSLVDRRTEPFFAIDNHGSKDIDQAMRLTRRPDGGLRNLIARVAPRRDLVPAARGGRREARSCGSSS